ncbi:hypothetical protein V8F33_007565 [Rhypophila sp. PSN 637]
MGTMGAKANQKLDTEPHPHHKTIPTTSVASMIDRRVIQQRTRNGINDISYHLPIETSVKVLEPLDDCIGKTEKVLSDDTDWTALGELGHHATSYSPRTLLAERIGSAGSRLGDCANGWADNGYLKMGFYGRIFAGSSINSLCPEKGQAPRETCKFSPRNQVVDTLSIFGNLPRDSHSCLGDSCWSLFAIIDCRTPVLGYNPLSTIRTCRSIHQPMTYAPSVTPGSRSGGEQAQARRVRQVARPHRAALRNKTRRATFLACVPQGSSLRATQVLAAVKEQILELETFTSPDFSSS